MEIIEQEAEITQEEPSPSWLERPILERINLNWEVLIFIAILALAVFSRLYILGARVISHDENTHVLFSWQLFKGLGYQHDPLSHGPFQFHIIALSYFLFGDTEFTARLPAAIFNILAIAFLWNYRRYLGKAGMLIAALMFLISPYILFYARYARNESFITLYFVVMIWAMLRYLETGASRYLLWFTLATVMHFDSKETAFIYAAQALLFLAIYLIYRLTTRPWPNPANRNFFIIALIAAILLFGAAGTGFVMTRGTSGALTATETQSPAVPGQLPAQAASSAPVGLLLILGLLGVLALAVAAFFLLRGYTLTLLRSERSFDLLILLGTLVLPMLAAFPLKMLGWPVPTNAASVNSMTMVDMLRMGIFIGVLSLLAIAIGLWWNPRLWLVNAALFYALFTIFYTTIFTNGAGFFTGLLGSLGYWLEQQGVNRGSQPWYYYAAIQVPVYEYLPALGSLYALYIVIRKRIHPMDPQDEIQAFEKPADDPTNFHPDVSMRNNLLIPVLLGFWSITAVLAYSIAGEKMPWLTVHIALPMIVLAAWAFGQLVERINWTAFRLQRGYLVVILLPIFFFALFRTLGALLGPNPPFQGKELIQLQNTSTFIFSLLATFVTGGALLYLARTWAGGQLRRLLALTAFALLAVLTARTAITASFINYDDANELLVYAHGAPGQKIILNQIEEISRRLTGGLGINVAYDNESNYSFWWYLRNYPNKVYYGTEPTRALQDSPLIVVGDTNYTKVEPIVRDNYYQFDYIRLWWPNQDYFDLTPSRILYALTNPQMRSAIFQIWLNRDYTQYGKATGKDMSLTNWYPSARERLYIRKDIAAKLWNYGVSPTAQTDPYQGKQVKLNADKILGAQGTQPGQFQKPRGVAVAPDGSLYVADTGNNRIQHIDTDGNVLQVWGTFADISKGAAPGGTFYEPWGIAASQDGSVYVADTWNHRIQKFTSDGKFVTMWGFFGTAETPDALWGPRDIAIDKNSNLLVTDTGNKRVVVFDPNGKPITQFGTEGSELGQFNEPVGIAVGPDERVFVDDTWNQRIQAFAPDGQGNYQPSSSWEVSAWYGESLDNKPYLAVDQAGNVFTTDPEGDRVLEFTGTGQIIRIWGDLSTGPDGFGMAGAVAVDAQGGVWVTDAGNGRVMRFTMPK